MKKNIGNRVLFFLLLGVWGLGIMSYMKIKDQKKWYEKSITVCHALGMTKEGDVLTNSLEAFEYNYELGQRVFEVDLAVTSDNVVVLRHDWVSDLGQAEEFGWTEEVKEIPDAEKFLNTLILDKYTPITLRDLYEIMAEKKDIYVILDSKYTPDVTTQFEQIVNTATENGYESVLERIVPQIYYEEMYDKVESVYAFKEYIYTLYYIGYPGADEVGSVCERKNISVLVMPYTWFGTAVYEELEKYSLQIYVHTVNDKAEAGRMLNCGARGVYTDCILPEELENR